MNADSGGMSYSALSAELKLGFFCKRLAVFEVFLFFSEGKREQFYLS